MKLAMMQSTRNTILQSINRAFICASMTLLFFFFIIFVVSLSSYFSRFDNIEESAYTYTSALNYLKYGPSNSLLLQDFSSSPSPDDHPYVYNHMPPGPDLLMAGVLRLTNIDFVKSRTWLAALSIFGFLVYLAAAFQFLQRHRANFSGICIFVMAPWMMSLIGRLVYAFTPFLTFFPILMYLIYLKRPQPLYFGIVLISIIISALYIEYSFLSAIIFCWLMLFLTGLLPLTRRQIMAVGAAFACGIILHLIQNFLYLGPALASKELLFTLANRITGHPTQSELHSFYESVGIVHHGAHPIVPSVLANVFVQDIAILGLGKVLELIIYLIIWAACVVWAATGGNVIAALRAAVSELRVPAKLLLWVIVTVSAPIFLFPAFAQEVHLSGGASMFFVGILTALIMGRGLFVVISEGQRCIHFGVTSHSAGFLALPHHSFRFRWQRLSILAVRAALVLAIAVTLAQMSSALISATVSQVRSALQDAISPDLQKSLYAVEKYNDGSFMTNINSPTVGFLTRQPGFGVCGPNSIEPSGEIRLVDCKIAFMRRVEHWREQRPRYFFYFEKPNLFPGFADCLPQEFVVLNADRGGANCMIELLNKLSANYPMVLQNDTVRVFDLGGEIEVGAVDNNWPREGSINNWWYWVHDLIGFTIHDHNSVNLQRRVSFDYYVLSDQNLTLNIIGENEQAQRLLRDQLSALKEHFEMVLPASIGRIKNITISGDGEAKPLSQNDQRLAKFRIFNLKIKALPLTGGIQNSNP